jgi:hypothetical protein
VARKDNNNTSTSDQHYDLKSKHEFINYIKHLTALAVDMPGNDLKQKRSLINIPGRQKRTKELM